MADKTQEEFEQGMLAMFSSDHEDIDEGREVEILTMRILMEEEFNRISGYAHTPDDQLNEKIKQAAIDAGIIGPNRRRNRERDFDR